jgi:SSS family solute:Na+ symporter
MVNSATTIFTLDIYKPLFKEESSKRLVFIGKAFAGLSLLLGVIVAPMLGGLDQAFQYIQEYTGFISPGVVVVFLFGMFWKKASANGAFWTIVFSIPLSIVIKYAFPDFPFMDRMGVSFLVLTAVLVIISLVENKEGDQKAIYINPELFKTSRAFNISTFIIIGILAFLYAIWW